MPLLINNKVVTIKEIKNYNVNSKDGVDDAMVILHNSYNELKERFWDKGVPVVFKYAKFLTVKNKTGHVQTKGGIYIPWSDIINTKTGTVTVTYCETILPGKVEGIPIYSPPGKSFYRSLNLHEKQSELALFMFGVSSIIKKSNKIILQDLEADADKIVVKRRADVAIDFYLYSGDSPLAENRDRLVALAQAWGIPKAGSLSDNVIKNRLHDIISKPNVTSELSKESFIKFAKEPDPLHDTLSIIGKAIDTGVLEYDKFEWVINDGNKKTKMMNIPPQDKERNRIYLAQHLLANAKDYARVKSIVNPTRLDIAPDGEQVEGGYKVYDPKRNYTEKILHDMHYIQVLMPLCDDLKLDRGQKKDIVIPQIMAAIAILREKQL